jgi:hypothetical protein
MSIVKVKCIRCRKVCRNDGTEEQPKWVCNNPECVRYVPPTEEEPVQEETPVEEPKQEEPAEEA